MGKMPGWTAGSLREGVQFQDSQGKRHDNLHRRERTGSDQEVDRMKKIPGTGNAAIKQADEKTHKEMRKKKGKLQAE